MCVNILLQEWPVGDSEARGIDENHHNDFEADAWQRLDYQPVTSVNLTTQRPLRKIGCGRTEMNGVVRRNLVDHKV